MMVTTVAALAVVLAGWTLLLSKCTACMPTTRKRRNIPTPTWRSCMPPQAHSLARPVSRVGPDWSLRCCPDECCNVNIGPAGISLGGSDHPAHLQSHAAVAAALPKDCHVAPHNEWPWYHGETIKAGDQNLQVRRSMFDCHATTPCLRRAERSRVARTALRYNHHSSNQVPSMHTCAHAITHMRCMHTCSSTASPVGGGALHAMQPA